jgi:prepilin-type N-terminal cleavage/methylation domain-containing protein
LVRRMEGFSLVELMMVICVLALISAIATPSLLNWRSNAKLRGAASNLKGDMELARLKAIQVNDTVVIHFTTNGYKIFKDDAGEALYGARTLPAGVNVDLGKTTFAGLSARFKGRGTARAGTAVLVNDKGTKKKVIVSPLGRITITGNE